MLAIGLSVAAFARAKVCHGNFADLLFQSFLAPLPRKQDEFLNALAHTNLVYRSLPATYFARKLMIESKFIGRIAPPLKARVLDQTKFNDLTSSSASTVTPTASETSVSIRKQHFRLRNSFALIPHYSRYTRRDLGDRELNVRARSAESIQIPAKI